MRVKESACESICFDLKNYGYTTNVIHNNEADFYQRNQIFGRLGYDNFISIEYIEEYDLTPTGWCTDDCLVGEIVGILEYSEEKDFIYTISVEGHGAYVPVTEDMFLDEPDMEDSTAEIAQEYDESEEAFERAQPKKKKEESTPPESTLPEAGCTEL